MSNTNPSSALRDWIRPRVDQSWRPTSTATQDTPRHIKKCARNIEKRFGEIAEPSPNEKTLDIHLEVFLDHWDKHRDFTDLPPQTWRVAPWLLFYPPGQSGGWPARERGLTDAFVKRSESTPRARHITATLRALLLAYPTNLVARKILSAWIIKRIGNTERTRLKRWDDRQRNYSILSPDGPAKVAALWNSSGATANQFLEEAGLAAELSRCHFLEVSTKIILKDLEKALRSRQIDHSEMDRQLEWLLAGDQLRFENLRIEMAKALLAPFESQKPAPDIEKPILEFLLRYFGDPRTKSKNWANIPEKYTNVIRKWLVGAALEDFFRIIDETALDSHWRYRKHFWNLYRAEDLIEDAWVLLGPQATRDAREGLGVKLRAGAGRLLGGDGAQSDHSVLMLRLAGVTVVEWSHNGKCRFWLDSNRNRPQMNDTEYRRHEIVYHADFEVVHSSSDRGGWQRKIADWLTEQIGVTMPAHKLLPGR